MAQYIKDSVQRDVCVAIELIVPVNKPTAKEEFIGGKGNPLSI